MTINRLSFNGRLIDYFSIDDYFNKLLFVADLSNQEIDNKQKEKSADKIDSIILLLAEFPKKNSAITLYQKSTEGGGNSK